MSLMAQQEPTRVPEYMKHLGAGPLPQRPRDSQQIDWRLELGDRTILRTRFNSIIFDGDELNPNDRWLGMAVTRGCILVTTVADRFHSYGPAPDPAAIWRSSRLFGGLIRVLTQVVGRPGADSIVKYQLLLPTPTSPAQTFILDTNVLIDMEHFYDGRLNDQERRRALKSLLLFLCGRDLVPGGGLIESGQSRQGTERDLRRRDHLREAFQKLVLCTPEELEALFYSNDAPRDTLADRPLDPVGFLETSGIDDETTSIRRFHSFGYSIFLKTMLLTPPQRKFSSIKARFEAYEEFARWVIDEVPVVLSHEFMLATEWFVGRQRPEDVRHILKLLKFQNTGAQRIHDAWGAAWDIFFLRMIDGSTWTQRPDLRNPVLVSNDQELPTVQARVRPFTESAISVNGTNVPITESSYTPEPRMEIYTRRFKALHFDLMQKQLMRQISGFTVTDATFDRSLELVAQLESSLRNDWPSATA